MHIHQHTYIYMLYIFMYWILPSTHVKYFCIFQFVFLFLAGQVYCSNPTWGNHHAIFKKVDTLESLPATKYPIQID